jgi:high-affinity iron transporter
LLSSTLLSLREGLEAALIIGIVLGALRQMRRRDLSASVWAGTLSALVVCTAAAIGLNALGVALKDPGEAIFEGFTMLLAAGILTWMIFWMARQSRNVKADLEDGVQQASRSGKRGMFFLAFIAVLREGVELALFLTASAFASDSRQTLLGALLGLGTAILLGAVLFATTVRLNLQRFFQVTGFLLILFAAGLTAHGIHEFNEVGWIPVIIEHVWDVNPILNENSTLGEILKSLLGYNGNPSLTEVLAYAAYFGAVLFGLRAAGKQRRLEPMEGATEEGKQAG